MTYKKPLSEKERQVRTKEKKTDKGLRQVSMWLDEQTIRQLNVLAKENGRTALMQKIISSEYEQHQSEQNGLNYDENSDFGMWN